MAKQKQIDWEQRRYEIATAALPVLQRISSEMTKQALEANMIKDSESWHRAMCGFVCDFALDLADELIERLKNGNETDNQ